MLSAFFGPLGVISLLQEDDLFAKVKEIVGHLEKLEDYHRGDGMRVQKMLGDMYWDYTPLREMVGDCMGDCGYAGELTLSVTLFCCKFSDTLTFCCYHFKIGLYH